MEFCYLFFFLANPTRKHKTRERTGETGTKIKFVNEIYKQGFAKREKSSIQMHKIDSVYGLGMKLTANVNRGVRNSLLMEGIS